MPAVTQPCPTCGATLPVHHGYLTWCHECGWNLSAPSKRRAPASRLERVYARVGRQLGDRLVERLLAENELQPRLTPSLFAAYAIAVMVYLLTAAFFIGGLVLAVLAFPNPAAIVAAVILVGLAWLMRPRLGNLPDEGVLDRDDAPVLYGLVDDVARSLEVDPVDVVVVDSHFNASWQVVGVRRKRVLTLGLPLLTMLTPQERVALIGHELAHARNGDATRGLLVGSAVRALEELYSAIAPEDFGGAREWGELALFERLVNLILWVFSRPALGVLVIELHLVLRDYQRAEYLADALAAKAAGTDAAVSLQEKSLLESTFWYGVQATAKDRSDRTDLFDALARLAAAVPDRERERRRQVARLEGARLDATHPPTADRIRLLEGRKPASPGVLLEPETSAAIDRELRTYRRRAQDELVEIYRDSLYAR